MIKDTELALGHDASLRNKVFKYIKTQIITGQYGPGESLVESKLAEELGVSRTPIREAIRLLELEGLVEITPNKGAVVLGITKKDVEDIYAIRRLIEGLAARWGAKLITAHDKKEMEKIIDLMEFYAQRGDVDEVADLDNKFHEIIYEASGSKILKLTLCNLHQYVQLARLESLKKPSRISQTLAEHRAILDAFNEGDPDKAEAAVSHHVNMAYENIKRHE
ncbi:MAG: GntR family transcriptional regulator [Peptococcaceae bacterium]|nr:GntR family transcriptional regulator [Peptococcaceae bacterium]MDH7524001.1 GntR family transcriptional regulator [Peptococcaceae bacterium]